MSTAAIAVRHQLSPSPDTIVPNSGALNSKMPHTNHSVGAAATSSAAPSSPGDDFGSTDEVKVFKDEGEKEDEQSLGENLLLEEKSSLIDLTESEVRLEEP
jgi:N-terminal CTNNB1 binding